MQVGLAKKGSAKLSVYRLKTNPTKPASNPFKNGCLICLLSEAFLREDALGMEQIKLSSSPAPRGALGSRRELLFKPPQHGSSASRHFLASNQPFYSQGEPSLASSKT